MLDLAAVVTLLLAAWASWQRLGQEDLFWILVAVAATGPLLRLIVLLPGSAWQTDLAAALWVSIGASIAVFAGVATMTHIAWRLLPLLLPYLVLLALIATMGQPRRGGTLLIPMMRWLEFHIIASVATYGVLTIAAIAALAAFLQEGGLKAKKRPTMVSRLLPSVSEAESLSNRLLAVSQVMLGLGLISGMAVQYLETGMLLRFNHKTLLSLLTFIIIATLLLVRRLIGIRGRIAAEAVLFAYLLLTLAYPGVKFVTDILLK